MFHLRRSISAAAAAVVLALGLSACGTGFTSVQPNGISVSIGARAGFDNQVLAELYGQALEAHGYSVDYNTGIGTRKSYLADLQSGVLDIVPEYAGSLLQAVSEGADATTIDTIETALPVALSALDLTVLKASKAKKSRVFVTTEEFARAHSIVQIADLSPIAPAITFGSADDLESSSYGRRQLEFAYAVSDWMFRSAPDEATVVKDLLARNIQVADLSSTNPAIAENDLVELRDPDAVIPAQNVIPVLNLATATPELSAIVDQISRELTTKDLTGFSESEDALPSAVARKWLVAHGFTSTED